MKVATVAAVPLCNPLAAGYLLALESATHSLKSRHLVRTPVGPRKSYESPMNESARPFTVWMRRAQSETTGLRFLDLVTQEYRESRSFVPQKVVGGVGRGFTLLRNARKWSHPSVGAGSPKAVEARGRQWRVVMAYGGFEIFAKAHMCHFKAAGPPPLSHFVQTAQRRLLPKAKHQHALPAVATDSVKILATAKSLVNEGTGDGQFWHGWLAGLDEPVDSNHAVQLARVVRNLSAHGILSPDLAIRLGAVALCDALVNAIVGIAGEVGADSVSRHRD